MLPKKNDPGFKTRVKLNAAGLAASLRQGLMAHRPSANAADTQALRLRDASSPKLTSSGLSSKARGAVGARSSPDLTKNRSPNPPRGGDRGLNRPQSVHSPSPPKRRGRSGRVAHPTSQKNRSPNPPGQPGEVPHAPTAEPINNPLGALRNVLTTGH